MFGADVNTQVLEAEAEVSTKKCRMCGFSSKSKFIIRQHMVSRHGLELVQENEHKYFVCHEVLKERIITRSIRHSTKNNWSCVQRL